MKRLMINRKGQFSIIAALFVAVILISSVMVTYSNIRYNTAVSQPQIMNAVDETNLALKQVLGFTVGYYGSIMQVTGNSSYAYTESENYFGSGLSNIMDVNPSWSTSFGNYNLSLSTNWFTNSSYSQGSLNITYDLLGLGVKDISYSVSAELSVQVIHSSSGNQVSLTVTQDANQPDVTLSKSNFKFYQYQDSNLTWGMISTPEDPIVSSDGTYTLDIPSGINPQSFIIQVQDQRGIMVAASSFSHYTGTLTYNSTSVGGGDYVNQYNSSVDGATDLGAHSNFTAQQQAPEGTFDTLTEAYQGTTTQSYHPTDYLVEGSTTRVSGTPSNLVSDDGVYMTFQSGTPSLYAHKETTTISGATYYQSKTSSADASGLTLAASMANSGRIPLGKFVYSLQGVTSIPASTWTMDYRAQRVDSGKHTARGYIDVDIIIREANGAVRTIIAAKVAASPNISTTMSTLSGTYSFSAYTVASSTDYLEIDYYVEVSTAGSSSTANLVIDNNSLALADQTRASNVILPGLYTCEADLWEKTDTNNWNYILWSIDMSSTLNNANAVIQLYNDSSGQYSQGGEGYLTQTLGTSIKSYGGNITTSPIEFRDALGTVKIRFTVTATTSTPFQINVDSSTFTPGTANYEANLEEQWTNLNVTTLLHPDLCIYAGTLGTSSLSAYAWYKGWHLLTSGLTSGWNNISIGSYLPTGSSSTTFTIRFFSTGDNAQNSWQVASVLIRPQSDLSLFNSLSNPAATVALELLQNGTMVWLGQNLQITTQAIPIPPVPVKAIHVNETIGGINEQVPFQIEDWASDYTVPLGLTNNATVFGNRQMIVFLVNTHVSAFTLWWNGSSQAVQTSLAFRNTAFHDTSNAINNGQLSVSVGTDNTFTITSTVVGKSTSSQVNFMRINSNASTYGAGSASVIVNGTVRDILQQEAEWSYGAGSGPNGNPPPTCPNIYANIVLTLPADASYYTFQTRIFFLNSTAKTRSLSDVCPVRLTTSATPTAAQTENGTAFNDPVVATANGAYYNYNYPAGSPTNHQWSQLTWGTNQGVGIMFTNSTNQGLYAFDKIAGAATGSINVNLNSKTIEFDPVTQSLAHVASFPTPNSYTIMWSGVVATFDGTTPIYNGTEPGLWVLAEMPPSVSVFVGN